MFKQTEIIDGCYYRNARYWSKPTSNSSEVLQVAGNLSECQALCRNSVYCQYFGFKQEDNKCWLVGADAVYVLKWSDGIITGPKVCPAVPSGCSELPTAGPFPGADKYESKMAWPSHRVPNKLECWPKNYTGGWFNSCPVQQVLEDTALGWPGKCMGLQQVVVPFKETCESFCVKRVTCSVYQVTENKTCYHARLKGGSQCFQRQADPDFVPFESKRIMHGNVRILAQLQGVEIVGLSQAFECLEGCRNGLQE